MASQHKGGPGRGSPPNAPRRTASHKPVNRPSAPAWTAAQWLTAMQPLLGSLNVMAALSPAQQQSLASYMVLLAHWNSTFNLTSLRDPQDMLTHHLADCLVVLGPLQRHLAEQGGALADAAADAGGASTPEATAAPSSPVSAASPAIRLLDVGSGGGLPGVVLAIACPNLQVTCVDTVGKKAAFIRQVAAELKLPNLRAEHARVEQLSSRFDVITSRAFASLLDFVSLTRDRMAEGAVWMAMKGKQPDEELAVLPPSIKVFHVEQLNVPGLDAQRCLVWMRPD